MDIDFRNNSLQKCCNNYKDAVIKWGAPYARKVITRMNELRAADKLADISHLPPARLHDVNGIRTNCFSVDVIHPARLIFKINQDPIPRKVDGGVDLLLVTCIKIWEVEDYHGKQKK